MRPHADDAPWHCFRLGRGAFDPGIGRITALRKLTEKNPSNLTPHPVYSGFYYSHPTLLECERALKELNASPAVAA